MALNVNEVQLVLAGQGQVTINWGDGSSETITATEAPVTYKHAYSTIDRFLIDVMGPGTVTKLHVHSTPKSRLEEIRSFGQVGLQEFTHEIQEAGNNSVLEQNYLTEIPETIPTSLKSLNSLFAYCTNPPVQKTFTWDWSNLEFLDRFLQNAKNFEFVWKDKVFTNLLTMSDFAQRAQNAKIYFDNVKFQGNAVGVDRFLQNSRDVEFTALRSSLKIYEPTNFVSGSRNIELTLFKCEFPGLYGASYMFYGTTNAKMTLDDVSYPLVQSANMMFAQGGSEYSKSNDPGYGAKLTLRNFKMPMVNTANSMFSGWTNATLDLDMSFTATLDSATGLFAFTTDSTVIAPSIKIKSFATESNFIELVTLASDSSFEFPFFEIGEHSVLRNTFNSNSRCKFNLNSAKLKSASGFKSAFMGCSNIELSMTNVVAEPNVDLTDAFSNISKSSRLRLDNWVFEGGARLVRTFAFQTEATQAVALNWTFGGIANLTQLCRGTQPFVTSYSGQVRGGSTIDISGWTFNGDTTTRDLDSPSILQDGLIRESHNATIIANDWTFNAGAQINLGEHVRSMNIYMSNWIFNNNASLNNFADSVGIGNLSVMSITLNNWQFNPAMNNVVDEAFKSFGKRGTTLFGDKENAPIYLNGLGSWPPSVFDSAVNVKQGAGSEVFGLDAYSF